MATPKQTDATSRETIAYFNAAKGNVTRAAETALVSRETFQSRLRTAKRDFPGLVGKFTAAESNAAVSADRRAARETRMTQTIGFYNAAKGDVRAAAIAADLSYDTFRERLADARKVFPQLLGDFTQEATEKADRTLEDRLTEDRALKDAATSKAHLKDALGKITNLEDKLRDYQYAGNTSLKPALWTLPEHDRQKREHTPYLLTSDFQVGEVIKADETETGYGYDTETFIRRYRKLIETTIYLSFDHAGSDWTYPGIIYARGGDTISGGIHEELQDTDDLTPIEAVEVVFEQEAAGITLLADAFGKVDVKSPDAAGNHDRNTHKPRSKNASGHSYDRLISYMLKRHFMNDDRVTFQTSPSFDVFFPIYDMNILLTHGDRIGSGGGTGFIGPAANIMKGAQKVIAEQAAIGRKVDRVDMGHFHTPICLDWVICNGCLPGYSEYAKSFRMRPSPPQQFLLYHHPKRGVVDIKPITLTDA